MMSLLITRSCSCACRVFSAGCRHLHQDGKAICASLNVLSIHLLLEVVKITCSARTRKHVLAYTSIVSCTLIIFVYITPIVLFISLFWDIVSIRAKNPKPADVLSTASNNRKCWHQSSCLHVSNYADVIGH